MGEQSDEIGRSAGSKPEVAQLELVEAVEDAEGVEDVYHLVAEVVTVVFLFQQRHGVFVTSS